MKRFKRLLAGFLGNSLEWYDFALYGCLAPIIAQQFFPKALPASALLATFVVFALGFLARPIGAIVFGHYGDRIGRRLPLLWSIYGISLPTALIGCLPSYASIGLWAPLLLVVLRLIQGFMVGGEYTGSLLFLAEDHDVNQRAQRGSLAMISTMSGILLGSLVATVLSTCCTPATVQAWAWRVPFILAVLLGGITYHCRRLAIESPVFQAMQRQRAPEKKPLLSLFKQHTPIFLLAIGLCALVGTTEYLLFTFLPSFIAQHSHLPLNWILTLNTIGMVWMLMLLKPIAAYSDRVGRRPILVLSALFFLVLSWPIFQLLAMVQVWAVILGLLLFNTGLALACAPMPALYMELFPTEVRYTGIALSYNLSFAVFAGTAPMLAALSQHYFSQASAPALVVMASALLSGCCFYFMPETFRKPL